MLRAESLEARLVESDKRASEAEGAAADARAAVAALRHTIAKYEMEAHVAKAASARAHAVTTT